jgi:urease accessory protein
MFYFHELLENAQPARETLTVPWDVRCRSRFAARLDSGHDCGVLLPRGTTLKEGDRLRAEDGTVALVRAAPEELSVVYCDDFLPLLRAAYHLGNRHVPLQVELGRLAYQHDHVLDGMVRELGLTVAFEVRSFEPESGAYRSGHGGHHHDHGHHDHGHHDHGHHNLGGHHHHGSHHHHGGHHHHHHHDDPHEDAPDTHRTPHRGEAMQ